MSNPAPTASPIDVNNVLQHPGAQHLIMTNVALEFAEYVGAGLTVPTVQRVMQMNYQECDKLVAEKLEASPLKPACKVGCTRCCWLEVELVLPELVHLAAVIKAHPEADTIKARIAAARPQIEGLSLDERWQLGPPCPLLQNDMCMVYADRPFNCRGWNSLDYNECGGNSPRVPIWGLQHTLCRILAISSHAAFGLAARMPLEQCVTVELIRGLDAVLNDGTIIPGLLLHGDTSRLRECMTSEAREITSGFAKLAVSSDAEKSRGPDAGSH